MIKWYEKYPEEFREVLSKVFRNNFFDDYNDKQYILTDHGISVTIEVFEHSLSIIELEGDKSFLYLKNKKCADKVYNMYIFEFSKSRKENDELLEQLEGACLRAIAVLSYFKNITLNKVYLFFVRKDISTNPIYYRREISNKKLSVNSNEFVELDNLSYIFIEDKLKIKLLEHNQTYSIKKSFK